ncbi:MAG: ParA family protein [Acetobacteraceae bacterium]
MAVIAFASQKGGVGNSTLCRALAVEAIRAGLKTVVSDLDAAQGTVHEWAKDRAKLGLEPPVAVRLCRTAAEALDGAGDVDLLLVDGPAKADVETLALARVADLIVQPCGGGLDDLRPAIRTFNGLIDRGVPRDRLLMALVRVGSEAEASNARDYLEVAGYACASGWLPERLTYRTLHNAGQSITEAKILGLRLAAEVMVQSIIDTAQAAQEAA